MVPLEDSPIVGYGRAYFHLVWLEQHGFENPSVELMTDGSGQFMVPLDAGPSNQSELVGEFLNVRLAGVAGLAQMRGNMLVVRFSTL